MTQKIFIVADFDDTIFAREEQLSKEQILRENRGDAGNKVMKEILGFDYMINNYYKNKNFPQEIIEKIRKNSWIVLTAWMEDYQKLKQKACNLNDIEFVVVEQAKQKPKRLVKYILEHNIKPDLIEIYEDRPKYFLENKDLLEQELNTKIYIYYVEMDGNRGYKKIKKLD